MKYLSTMIVTLILLLGSFVSAPAGSPAVRAEIADGRAAAPTVCAEFTADSSEQQTAMLFSAAERVTDLKFLGLTVKDFVDGKMVFDAVEMYRLPVLEPESPLLVRMTFWGDLPSYGISFTDKEGRTKRYSLGLSGADGSVVLNEIR